MNPYMVAKGILFFTAVGLIGCSATCPKTSPTEKEINLTASEKSAWSCYNNPNPCGSGSCPSGSSCKGLHNMNCGCVK